MREVGVVREIWRFPVKSMQGDRIESSWISSQGLAGDRAWAMRDELRREVQWGKRFPQLMQCHARYRHEPAPGAAAPVDITFPDGETCGSDTSRVHEKLSDLIGGPARLWPLQPASNVEFYRRYREDPEQFAREMVEIFAREPGEPVPDFATFPPVLADHVAVPGTFFDNEEVNLLSNAALAHMAAHNPDADWDVRRFRPNFLLDTAADLAGCPENAWAGHRLRIGEVELDVTMPTPRCGMTVQPQGPLPYDKSILRTIVKVGSQALGVGAHCRVPGRVRVGDAVVLLD